MSTIILLKTDPSPPPSPTLEAGNSTILSTPIPPLHKTKYTLIEEPTDDEKDNPKERKKSLKDLFTKTQVQYLWTKKGEWEGATQAKRRELAASAAEYLIGKIEDTGRHVRKKERGTVI